MKTINRSILPLLACLAVLGLGLAFTPPAEAGQHHRNYKSAFNCPVHGAKCGPDYRARYKHNRKAGKGFSCAYYDRYHSGRGYASYYGPKGDYRRQGNYRHHGDYYRGRR